MGGKGRGGKGEGKEREGKGGREWALEPPPSKKSGYGPEFIMRNFTDFWVYEAQNRLLSSSANAEQAQNTTKILCPLWDSNPDFTTYRASQTNKT